MNLNWPNFRHLAGALSLLACAVAFAQQPLWQQARSIGGDLNALSIAAVGAWEISFDTDGLSARQATIALPHPQRGPLMASHRYSAVRAADDFTWVGQLDADGTDVVLTVRHGLIAGLIYTHDQVFELRAGSPRGPVLLEINQDRFPGCDGGVEPPADFRVPSRRPLASPAPESPVAVDSPIGDETVIVDLLVLYTAAARSSQGGIGGIETLAQAAVANANTAFVNAEVDVELRIVHMAELDFVEGNSCSGSDGDLLALRSNSNARQLRDQYLADMVGLLVGPQSSCGCGYVMRNPGPGFEDFAYQVTGVHCAVGNLTYAHEHGHNLGLEHDPANGTSPGNASYSWSFGHFQSNSFRTVMSYANQCSSCPRRMYFSNPDVSYQGNPTGIADQRDNARTVRLTAPIAANFRSPPKEPAIEVSPSDLNFRLGPGQVTASQALTIDNIGEADLVWSIAQTQAAVALTDHNRGAVVPDRSKAKGSTDVNLALHGVGESVACDAPQDIGWLSVDASDGVTEPGSQTPIQVNVDGTELDQGWHEALLCIDSNDATQSRIVVPVSMEVRTEPHIFRDHFDNNPMFQD